VSALAGTISAPFVVGGSGEVSRRLRSAFSLLLALAILVVALSAVFGSGAKGAGVDPVQVFSSGPLVAVETDGAARLSIGGLIPGQSRSATIRLSNGGSESASFNLSSRVVDRVGPGGASLSSALVLQIASASTGAVLYRGPIGRMAHLGLGAIAADAQRAYRFTVTLPGSVGNEVAGSSMSAGFAWNAA
jgi:hypothetical protein